MITRYPELGSSSANPLTVSLSDGVQLDAFSRLRVSQAFTLFDSQQEYGLDTLRVWDITANGTLPASGSTDGSVTSGSNLVGPRNVNTRMTPITCSSTSGHYSILQSRQYVRYIPGKSHLVLLTGIFSPGTVANNVARSGYFDSANGIFLEVGNGIPSIVMRTSTSGSAVDTAVAQSAWNIDKLDGTGVSGKTIDLTKTQILFIQAQWLAVGRVIVGFDIDGMLYPCHQFLNANNLTVPYTQSFNLPVRMEVRNTGTSSGTPTIQFICCSVQSEGGEQPRGFPNSAPAVITTTAVTTRRPVLSIRPKATYNSVTNRAHIEDIEVQLRATTNDSLFELVIGGTLTGAAFASVAAESIVEYDTTATAISGGTAILKGFVPSATGSIAGTIRMEGDIRFPLVLSQIDALTATQTPFSIVCTSFGGTSNITPVMNWHEQVI